MIVAMIVLYSTAFFIADERVDCVTARQIEMAMH